MTAMKRKLYEALRSIGIADQHAMDVSEAVSEDILALHLDLEKLRDEVRTLRWMVIVVLALVIGNLWLSSHILSRLP